MGIDLGELPREEPPPPPAPGWRHRYAWARRRPRGWFPAAAVALALALATAGAAPAPPPWATPHFAVPLPGGPLVEVDAGYVYVGGTDADGRRRWRAYQLADGAFAWENTAPVGAVARDGAGRQLLRRPQFTVEFGVPMQVAYVHVQEAGWRSHSATVTVLDRETGRPRWTYPGAPAGVTAGGLLLVTEAPFPLVKADRPVPEERVKAALDPATGEVVFRIHKAPGDFRHDGTHLVNENAAGGLASYRLDTGAPLASIQVPPEDAAAPPGPVAARVVNGLALAVKAGRLVARDAGTLAVRWRVAASGVESVVDCGPVLCLLRGDRLDAHDPATGQLRWSAGWPVRDLGRHAVRWWPDGHLLVLAYPASADAAPRHQVLDAATGELVLDLAGWHPISHPATAGSTLLTRQADGRLWVGRAVLNPPRVEVLGAVDPGVCQVAGEYLVCEGQDQVEVWRLHL